MENSATYFYIYNAWIMAEKILVLLDLNFSKSRCPFSDLIGLIVLDDK